MVMVTGKRPVVPEIDPQQAWERASRGDAVIVDVREPDEVAEVAVPGALVIPLGKLDEEVETIPSDREVLFLCRSGNRSAYATDFYRQRGHERTANITGGIIAWTKANLPTTRGR
ncbi:rhodanese-like domain-containing protein [Sphaerobacter thermophilus]|uniref:Rhodanese domain protein n=1 Tax=Sphaerobacter thermophilus (strain ATCC 49802 / DSM 20745 / KCCM 41009 / NCIMB 13125 / S 6022) TaxID=479434 RepID=D1C2P7_SPHTD|nr:rhodanese-like domain-containing protein [Sphaerobacter thermophilus]ACZ38514.1 Rhodanese domain protein [Sphaerobacter thermophilus DSM 20745]